MSTSGRVSWDEYFLRIAEAVRSRSTCLRGSTGCVLVKDGDIIATGYNGAPSGQPHCTDVGCKVIGNQCKRVVHDLQNAVARAARTGRSTIGSTAYVVMSPCYDCAKLIINAGIVRVVYRELYHEDAAGDPQELLSSAGVRLEALPRG